MANVDEWKWKLSLLLRNEKDHEIVSRDKRDRRDYEQISNLAKRMGLYRYGRMLLMISRHAFCYLVSCFIYSLLFASCSEIYGKVVVVSKVPLPNYRPDLDDKRPQREVRVISLIVQLFPSIVTC